MTRTPAGRGGARRLVLVLLIVLAVVALVILVVFVLPGSQGEEFPQPGGVLPAIGVTTG